VQPLRLPEMSALASTLNGQLINNVPRTSRKEFAQHTSHRHITNHKTG
jgi:hypothetical protein